MTGHRTDTSWHVHAACYLTWRTWTKLTTDDRQATCARCPVTVACLTQGIHDTRGTTGVWREGEEMYGGLDAVDLSAVKRRQVRTLGAS